jgi:hypothetical protein
MFFPINLQVAAGSHSGVTGMRAFDITAWQARVEKWAA